MSKIETLVPNGNILRALRKEHDLSQENIFLYASDTKNGKGIKDFPKLRTLQKAENGEPVGKNSLQKIAHFYQALDQEKNIKREANIDLNYITKFPLKKKSKKKSQDIKDAQRDEVLLTQIKQQIQIEIMTRKSDRNFTYLDFDPTIKQSKLIKIIINDIKELKKEYRTTKNHSENFNESLDADFYIINKSVKFKEDLMKLNESGIFLYSGNYITSIVDVGEEYKKDGEGTVTETYKTNLSPTYTPIIESKCYVIYSFSEKNTHSLAFKYYNNWYKQRLSNLIKDFKIQYDTEKFDVLDSNAERLIYEIFEDFTGYKDGILKQNVLIEDPDIHHYFDKYWEEFSEEWEKVQEADYWADQADYERENK